MFYGFSPNLEMISQVILSAMKLNTKCYNWDISKEYPILGMVDDYKDLFDYKTTLDFMYNKSPVKIQEDLRDLYKTSVTLDV